MTGLYSSDPSPGPIRARQDICDSQEAWWLRKGCRRARCQLIKSLADAFEIPITSMQDIQAHRFGELATFTSDTVEHDILRHGETEVAVYNLCTDTTKHMNGIVTNMHPGEGVWLFRYFFFTNTSGSARPAEGARPGKGSPGGLACRGSKGA